jgi:O-acetyl-ADP-ribose deacetylase (regulator of RNase III)
MLIYKTGDLMKFTEDAFGHGCNCQKRMASGVAYAVRHTYYEMVQADLDSEITPEQRLGTYIVVPLRNGKVGFNIYSQFKYGRDRVHVDYDALEAGVRGVCNELSSHSQKTLALPKIGCGLAGGDWSIVNKILEKISNETGVDITIYEFEPEIKGLINQVKKLK